MHEATKQAEYERMAKRLAEALEVEANALRLVADADRAARESWEALVAEVRLRL